VEIHVGRVLTFGRGNAACNEPLTCTSSSSSWSSSSCGDFFLDLAERVRSHSPRWWQRAAVISLAWSLILSVSLSRVYLGVQWISDVTAGIVGGVLWATVATVAFETLRWIRTIRAGRRGGIDHEVSA
jgi:PAP2 superfamily